MCYELGNYEEVIDLAQQARELVPKEDVGALRKILLRLSKARLFLNDFLEEILDDVFLMGTDEDSTGLLAALRAGLAAEDTGDSTTVNHGRVARSLPYYKSMPNTIPEFYTVGHDCAVSMVDPLLDQCSKDDEELAFLFRWHWGRASSLSDLDHNRHR